MEIGSFVLNSIENRLKEFKNLGKEKRTCFNFHPYLNLSYEADIFSELCFCILTANYSAEKSIKIQANIGRGFYEYDYKTLANFLRKSGYRFPEQRAERVVSARKKIDCILNLIEKSKDPREIRDLISHPKSRYKIKGFGYKEASHFLRNIGFDNIAILDRHILRFLEEKGITGKTKMLTSKLYEKLEEHLIRIAKSLKVKPSALDLYIFFLATGKVLK